MKRSFVLAILVLCAAACAVLLLGGWHTPSARVVAGFEGFTKGIPNWTVDSWFIQMSSQRAQLMQEWFQSGTNAARFGITNNTRHAIRVFPVTRFETSGQQRDTPVLTSRNFRGVYIGPGEAKSLQVASLPHSGRWRVSFCYVRDDGGGHLLADARGKTSALLTGASSPARFADEFRDYGLWFFSEWIEK
jgi:hypothetical protein